MRFLVLALALTDCAHVSRLSDAASMNLGFESSHGALPEGWTRGALGGFDVAHDSTVAHTGLRSVRITPVAGAQYGSLWRRVDAGPLVGKRVRLHGWVKTNTVAGWATVWLRVDGGQSTYVMANGPLGTTDWAEIVADAVIAPGKELTFGVVLGGQGGTAWFDDLSLEVLEPPRDEPIRLAGRVVDSANTPIADAEVALVDSNGNISQHARTSSDGAFDFKASSGNWSLSANAPSRPELVATFIETRAWPKSEQPVLVLSADAGVSVRGQLSDGAPSGAFMRVAASSKHNGDVWAVPVGSDGTFATTLSLADTFAVSMIAGGVGNGIAARDGGIAIAKLEVVTERPTPPAVLEWISRSAIPLDTVDPRVPLDSAALRTMIGPARVVALGEATHGTREFFQLKHRVFRALVSEGFSVFALEMGQADARAINAYVLNGTGTARTALANSNMWLWETEEVLELIEWMREWNSSAAHTTKLQFVGFDMQGPGASLEGVRQFLSKVAPSESSTLMAPLEVLRIDFAAFLALPKERQAPIIAALATLMTRFDSSRKDWEAASSPAAYKIARQDARTLKQAVDHVMLGVMSAASGAMRDEAMAENIKWLFDDLAPGARMVISAHNLHIANVKDRMGKTLRTTLGKDWLAIGLELGDGSFQALRLRNDGARSNIEEITLSPVRPGRVDAALRHGPEVYALDLRAAPRGVVADWFAAPQIVREVGYAFSSELRMTGSQVLSERYDALLFVAHTTRARPLPIDFTILP